MISLFCYVRKISALYFSKTELYTEHLSKLSFRTVFILEFLNLNQTIQIQGSNRRIFLIRNNCYNGYTCYSQCFAWENSSINSLNLNGLAWFRVKIHSCIEVFSMVSHGKTIGDTNSWSLVVCGCCLLQRSGPSCKKALEYLDKIRLGIVYSLFFHADNFQQIVLPFFTEVLPFVSAVTKPKLIQVLLVKS